MMQTAQTELEFLQFYLDTLSNKSVRYGEDYMTRTLPSPLRIKRTPTARIVEETVPTATRTIHTTKIQVTIKVLKPSSQFTIGGLTGSETVGQLKQRIYQQQSSIPVNRQRLLIKGKVLADQKTLEELSIQEGAVIHLMITAAPASPTAAPSSSGLSAEAEQKISSPEFWAALEKTVIEQLGDADAKLVLSKMKASLSA